jgi:T4 RnlA family RNA ligase
MTFYTVPKNLSELEHFRSNPMIQFKEETVNGVEVVIPVYMISTPELWRETHALELRGHVYDKISSQLISAALPKFFNVGENDYTQEHQLSWHEGVMAYNKFDGSMITFALINDKVYAKTKKSFYSDVAILAQDFLDNDPDGQRYVAGIKGMLKQGASPIYEFWHPEWQIVLNYGDKVMFEYLGYRDMNTGEWLPSTKSLGYDRSQEIAKDLNKFREEEGVEGVVIQFLDGRLVKVKTTWYMQQHHVRTDMRERDIAELAALEKIDDVKSLVTESGMDISLIEDIEKRVAEIIVDIKNYVEYTVRLERDKVGTSAKDMAQLYGDNRYFRLIMQQFRDQEPSYVQYFLQNHLKQDFGLKSIYNPKF